MAAKKRKSKKRVSKKKLPPAFLANIKRTKAGKKPVKRP